MDRPHNLMMICGVLHLPRAASSSRACGAVVEERFLRVPALPPAAGRARRAYAVWETDRDFDIDRHVGAHRRCPGRAGKRELQALVSRLVATPLDPARPLWQFHLVDNYDGGSALIVRIHHCYADGIALVRVMLSMTDAGRDGPPAMPFSPPKRKARDATTIRARRADQSHVGRDEDRDAGRIAAGRERARSSGTTPRRPSPSPTRARR